MHFFNPPALMKLVEVVATAESSTRALEATAAVGRRMGRTPIRAKDSPGFIANRLARPYSLESLRMLADGVADAPTIDRVLPTRRRLSDGAVRADRPDRARRQPQRGPFLLRPGRRARALATERDPGADGRAKDFAGARTARASTPTRRPPPRARTRPRNLAPTLDPDELARIDPAGPEIVPRLIAQIANEAAFALDEGVGSPEDMDTAMRLGFNWPLGPVEFTELIGARRALELLESLGRATATPTPGTGSDRGLREALSAASARGGRRSRRRSTSSNPRRARPSG